MSEIGYFYILTNTHHTVLYCGATNDLYRRIQEHKNKIYSNSFSARYNIDKLVYFESLSSVSDAFDREKQVKGGSRKKKVALIESINPEWKDLFDTISSGAGEELIRIKKFFK
jgi:putative endonuclease